MTELEVFLAPVDASSPSGVELRNDARFHAIERLLEPTSRSNRIIAEESGGAAAPVDWSVILEDARELAASGRDIRLLVIVVRALANDAGFAGLAEGLDLLTRTVATYWDSLHPMLRDNPSRREAATRRINALFQLENTDNGLLGDLEFFTVLNPRGLGPVRGRDLAAALLNRNTVLSEGPQGLGEKEQAALIAAHEARATRTRTALTATATERPDDLAALTAAVEAASRALGALEAALEEKVGENGMGVKFAALGTFLDRVAKTLASAKATAAQPEGVTHVPDAPPTAVNGTPAPSLPAAGGIPGQVTSRRDVERCLDMIIDFYERTEPSSPIPHLARRMRKMVPMNFLQLMEEIAPSGMKEFRSIAGVFDEKQK